MILRRPSGIEIAGQLLLLAMLALLAWDFVEALEGVACSAVPDVPDCYPWGWNETAYWHYGTKTRYLTHSGITLGVLIVAALAPFAARRPAIGLVSLASITVGGWLAVGYGLPQLMN